MLEQLLRLVAGGGVTSCEELAERLSTDRLLVEAMLEELVRLGYLRAVATGCAGHCTGCPIGGCSVTGAGRAWALTQRGAHTVLGGRSGTP